VSQPHEGARVSYIGVDPEGPEMGAQGRLLAITGRSGHVKWDDGRHGGQLTLTAMADIVTCPGATTKVAVEREATSFPELDDSLEFGHTAAVDDGYLDDYWSDEL
jgi:hypothetical protein